MPPQKVIAKLLINNDSNRNYYIKSYNFV